jgi:hypothetical protein
LLVGVFPAGSAHAWAKAHVFVGRAPPGRHCLSAVEALDGPGEVVVLDADATGVRKHAWAIDETSCTRARGAWNLAAPHVTWSGFPACTLSVDEPRLEARARAGPLGWWARLPGVVSYFSTFGDVVWRDARGESRGLGVLERAWGGDAPMDVAALAPKRWQWDVLRGDDGAVYAGLSVAAVGLRTMSLARDAPTVATGMRTRLRVGAWREEEGRRVPQRWEGILRTARGTLRYEARAGTPVAPMLPGGGFLGTSWEGEWTGSGAGRTVRGTGFTEYRAA